jgi:hypothetical protein
VNGAQGAVKKIWFDQGSNAHSHLPAVIFIKFDGYSGPETPAWEGIDPYWVPIIPAIAQWETKAGKALTHTQLPLMLAWGIIIHKSQGLTLEKAWRQRLLCRSNFCSYFSSENFERLSFLHTLPSCTIKEAKRD